MHISEEYGAMPLVGTILYVQSVKVVVGGMKNEGYTRPVLLGTLH